MSEFQTPTNNDSKEISTLRALCCCSPMPDLNSKLTLALARR